MSRPIRQLILHQTATATGTLESIRRYHKETLGWSDIGYHFLLTPDGLVHRGRPVERVGAHCRGDNAHSIGICCVGAGDAFPLDVGYMSTEMFQALLGLLQKLLLAYPMARMGLWGHNEKHSGISQGKSCPGFPAEVLRRLLT